MEELHKKILEIAVDVKWMKQDAIRRNGILERHVMESDKFRQSITRNTEWRHAYKIGFIIIFAILSFMAYYVF